MNATDTLNALRERALRGIAAFEMQREMMRHAIEEEQMFMRYDELLEAEGAVRTWWEVKGYAEQAVGPDDTFTLRLTRAIVVGRAVRFSEHRSTSAATNLMADAEHRAWLAALEIIENAAAKSPGTEGI